MSELWDCYDRDFNKVEGKVLVRGEESAFSDEEYHLVCDIAVRHIDGTYLLMQRDFRKEGYPGCWELTAGGSALQGEKPLECAKRELHEETGIWADTLLEIGRMTVSKNHCHYVVYLATVSCEKSAVTLQEGETVAYQWVEKSVIFKMKEKLATWRVFEMLPDLEEPKYAIRYLPKEHWKGTPIMMVTRSDSFYDVEISPMDERGCSIHLIRKKAEKEIVHTPDEYDFPDSLYQDHWEDAEAYGIIGANGELLACIEVCPENWSNRLMVTELWVCDELQKQGYGKLLMDKAKEVAKEQKRRALILETQSCNTNAIGFYLHQGFELIGFDKCCYTNKDIERQEVRINLGYFFDVNGRWE
ncbi:MAG: GNAT family N-acetyltransferase [Lachnospiraceae bacterium]|nr:GNAT family N-acetyltransferase [Lachnospiraceae bacterium]